MLSRAVQGRFLLLGQGERAGALVVRSDFVRACAAGTNGFGAAPIDRPDKVRVDREGITSVVVRGHISPPPHEVPFIDASYDT